MEKITISKETMEKAKGLADRLLEGDTANYMAKIRELANSQFGKKVPGARKAFRTLGRRVAENKATIQIIDEIEEDTQDRISLDV